MVHFVHILVSDLHMYVQHKDSENVKFYINRGIRRHQ
jgi:hypothetical protein